MKIELIAIDHQFALDPSAGKRLRFVCHTTDRFEGDDVGKALNEKSVSFLVSQLANALGIGDHVVRSGIGGFRPAVGEPGKEFGYAIFIYGDKQFHRDLTVHARRVLKQLDRSVLFEALS